MTLRHNALINLSGQLLSVAISIAAVPLLLRRIGEARYGVLLVVWVLLGYFALVDLGVTQATTQRMATLREASPSERNELLWTAVTLNTVMGLLGGAVLLAGGHLVFGHLVSMDEQLRSESLRALPWIALALPVSLFAAPLAGALQGREAFSATVVANTISLVCSQTFPIVVARLHSVSLEWLIPSVLVAKLISAVLLLILCKRIVPLHRPRFSRICARRLISYGGWVTVSSIVGPLMSTFDRLVIGTISGSATVTYYGVPQGLVSRFLILPNSISGVLLPRFAASSKESREALADVSVRAVASVMTPTIILALFLVELFLSLWINPEFASKAGTAARVLLVGAWFNGMATLAYSNIMGKGRPDLVAKMHLVELPAYLGFLALALWLWGVVGAAIAWTARVAVDAALLYRMSGILSGKAKDATVAMSLVIGTSFVAHLTNHLPMFRWLCASVLAGLAAVWALGTLPPNLRPHQLLRSGRNVS